MNLLLDTHILVWSQSDPSILGSKATKRLLKGKTGIYVSAASILELARLEEMGRLTFRIGREVWLENAQRNLHAEMLALDARILQESTTLPEPVPGDLVDRILVATARLHDLTILTADDGLLSLPTVRVLDARA